MEPLQLPGGFGGNGSSKSYKTLNGITFTTTGTPQPLANGQYYQLTNLVDGNLNSWYATNETTVDISITLSQERYVHRLRIFPVSFQRFVLREDILNDLFSFDLKHGNLLLSNFQLVLATIRTLIRSVLLS